MRGYVRIDGPGAVDGDGKVASALAKAISSCDADGIRAAVAQGASLTAELPETSMPPLLSAVYQFGERGGQKCVELLLKLGCTPDGGEDEPPLLVCAGDQLAPLAALKATELLVAHGADVNAANREGTTALFECVMNERIKLARFLMEHGAEPAIKDRNGMSAVAWVRKRYEEETGFNRRTHYAELLSLLTGQPVAKPAAQKLRPELRAENERFKFMKARPVSGGVISVLVNEPDMVRSFWKIPPHLQLCARQ